MFLSLRTTQAPTSDLGFLLHKHPAKLQSFSLAFGRAHVFYPEASEAASEAVLLLDLDPVGLIRRGSNAPLDQYVNDRPYVASSFFSVALARVYASAMSGACAARPELPERRMELEAGLAAVPCRGGGELLRRLFEPLGYAVEASRQPLDERFPDWGASPYWTLRLRANCRLQDLLTHLYVLLPVLDDDKHYWVGDAEVEKLLQRGQSWLAPHPERELIVERYLKHQKRLARQALERLLEEDQLTAEPAEELRAAEESRLEARVSLAKLRHQAVLAELRAAQPRSVLDLGCGEGSLLLDLARSGDFNQIVGLDVSHAALDRAQERLERLTPAQKERVRLVHGSLTYRDKRMEGFDAAVALEVIEHLDPGRLEAFERVILEFARPKTFVLTTPNVEYNALFETLAHGELRHRDHRFEWTRAEFEEWARAAAARQGYAVRLDSIGPRDEALGSPTQMAVFSRA